MESGNGSVLSALRAGLAFFVSCPYCGSCFTFVSYQISKEGDEASSASFDDGDVAYEQRRCQHCGRRWQTYP